MANVIYVCFCLAFFIAYVVVNRLEYKDNKKTNEEIRKTNAEIKELIDKLNKEN